jgi:hypothetical protein
MWADDCGVRCEMNSLVIMGYFRDRVRGQECRRRTNVKELLILPSIPMVSFART